MKKRILTVLCALALLVGAFGIVAAAVDANAVAVIGNTGYSSLQDAVDAIEEGTTGLIELKKSTNEIVDVSCDVYVDLAGNNIAGIDVKAGTFYGMDSATIIEVGDDADVSYGKIASVKGAVAAISVDDEYSADSYLKAEDNGTSFHAVNLRLTDMSLRAEDAGVYFKSNFAGDSVVASKVKNFGVALSIKGVPTAANIKTTDCARSTFSGFTAGVNDNATSTLLKGIMKESNEYIVNKRNANIPVYGRAYVELKNGTFIFGAAQDRSLKQQVQLLATANEEVVEMYRTFKPVMKEWEQITAVTNAYQAEEDEILKVLIVGNSHGLDSTNLLYEVFKAQNPDQKVVIGALYNDGCNMHWHCYNARNDRPFYSYHENGTNVGSAENDVEWEVTGVAKDGGTEGVSVRYGLENEPWDIVIMQEMNRNQGVDDPAAGYETWGWNGTKYQFLADLILDNVETTPALGFNMMWANPDDPKYLQDRSPEYPLSLNAGWGTSHKQFFPGADGEFDTRVQYEKMTENVQKYLVNNTEFMGKQYVDFILTPGTAVQYALDVQGLPQNQIYRDYTHMNDYGRVMAAYVWYAQLMTQYTGEKVTVDSINLNTIPASLHIQTDAPYPALDPETGDYPLSDTDKANILAAVQWTLEHPFTVEQN